LNPSSIQYNLVKLNERIAAACRRAGRSPSEVTLIAVSKTVEPAAMLEAYHCGIRHFGENRVQEAQRKFPVFDVLDPPVVRHLIGHLQSNKVKTALSLFDLIHSIDTLELAQAINRRAATRRPVLLEVNVSGEASKSGFSPSGLTEVFDRIAGLPNLEVRGLMTVAPAVDDPEEARPFFRQLRDLRDRLGLKERSMGMTGDFEAAIEEGATLIRVGRAIFGERDNPAIN